MSDELRFLSDWIVAGQTTEIFFSGKNGSSNCNKVKEFKSHKQVT